MFVDNVAVYHSWFYERIVRPYAVFLFSDLQIFRGANTVWGSKKLFCINILRWNFIYLKFHNIHAHGPGEDGMQHPPCPFPWLLSLFCQPSWHFWGFNKTSAVSLRPPPSSSMLVDNVQSHPNHTWFDLCQMLTWKRFRSKSHTIHHVTSWCMK